MKTITRGELLLDDTLLLYETGAARKYFERTIMRALGISICVIVALSSAVATADIWQPSPGNTQTPIWPGKVPDLQPVPGPEKVLIGDRVVRGKHLTGVTNVTNPTMIVYKTTTKNTGVAVVVFPGGGFQGLAMDGEGTEVCDWLTAEGITCVLLKYRVPSPPYHWQTNSRPHNLETPRPALEDAQRTMGLVRLHASEWGIDPHKVGVIGFSAGGFLVAEISTRYKHRLYAPVDDADKESCRPDFAIAVYPGHLWVPGSNYKLNPNVPVTKDTPPTFLVQAEDDNVDGVNQVLTYFIALKNAGVPAELHIYAQGGHAFGLLSKLPISVWPKLVDTWLRTIGEIPQ